ncbi:MAG TPA: hypothetical protein VFH92_05875, partial [Phenylobacterium sp.]|nr:hypothetical protein [Phenylobacterium sp.]
RALEGLALRLSSAPEVRAARDAALQMFLADPDALTEDGRATLQDAADQHFWGALLLAMNMDPHHPRIAPMFLYRHEIDGQAYPSALHGGIENPDNVYRLIPVSPDCRYELRGVRHRPAPAQVTYELMDSIPGVRGLGEQLALLMDRDMALGPDGSFVITLDSDPAAGRPNHIRMTPEARCLFVRDTLSDWDRQRADSLTIVRTAGPDASPRTEPELIADAAGLIPAYARFWLDLPKRFRQQLAFKTNAFDPPARRTGGWGFIANTHFELADDEAFVFTADPRAAPYHAALIANHWWIAMDADRRSGAFNTAQAQANRDGTITYVIAARDPGAHNWLDTGGVHTGIVQVRWQGTPADMAELPDAIGGARVVKLAALRAELPPETVWLTPDERQAQLAARHASYVRRLTSG